MTTKQQVVEELLNLENLQLLVETYQKIAAIRMRRVKDSVLNNREFIEGLTKIYQEVRLSYETEIQLLVRKRKKTAKDRREKMSLLSHNGKRLTILFSANTMLYGDIIRNVFDSFAESIKNIDTDVAIVGNVGSRLYKESKLDKPVKYFDLPDSVETLGNLEKIISYAIDYREVVTFHGKFENVLNQVPASIFVSGELNREVEDEQEQEEVMVRFIFEPTLENVLIFFEQEIFAAIVEQAMFESNLSKFASRMISLDSAVVSINKRLKKVDFEGQKLKHREFNIKQLNTLSGISVWGSAR